MKAMQQKLNSSLALENPNRIKEVLDVRFSLHRQPSLPSLPHGAAVHRGVVTALSAFPSA